MLFILLAIFAHAQIADTSFYSNGKVFSIKQVSEDELVYIDFTLSPQGDTVSLVEYDYSGDLNEFYYRSYCKNLTGEITLINDTGKMYKYSKEGDSIYSDRAYKYYNSPMFFSLRRIYNIDTLSLLMLDSIFIYAFRTYKQNSKAQFVTKLFDATNKLQFTDSLDTMPYILISSEMLYDTLENIRPIREYTISKEKLVEYYKLFYKKSKNLAEISKVYEYFRFQEDMSRGEWKFYSDIVKYLRGQISEEYLLCAFKYALGGITAVSTYSVETDKLFLNQYKQLNLIIDTLGNSFQAIKIEKVNDFKKSLSNDEIKTLEEVSEIYKRVINDYYKNFLFDNHYRNFGIDKNRIEYYRLITKWQLKFPNQRLFNQNVQEMVPKELESILKKIEEYLHEDKYIELYNAEQSMINSLVGLDRYTMTAYNHYFRESEQNRRKLRRFNWLIE